MIVHFLEPLLINFLFILFFIFIFHMFSSSPVFIKYRNTTMVILSSIAIIICMQFGVELIDGYYYDLRLIPLILCILYGGYKVGTGVIFITLIYRYFIGGEGFYVSLILFILVLISVALTSKIFNKSSMKQKILISVMFSILFNLMILLNFMLNFGSMPISRLDWIGVILIKVIGTGISTYIIETLENKVKLQNESIESEKQKLISSLAASIAHEVRNPLTVTKGFLQLLKEAKDMDIEQKKYIDFALLEIDRANSILTEYLLFAKPEIEKLKTLDLSKEITNTINLMRPLTNMNNILIHAKLEGPAEILGDSSKLQQCLMNIFKNSVEAIKEKNKTGIIEISQKKNDKHCIIIIRDNGIGMTKDQVKRLGTPYFSTKDQGTGLGMMVVFSLVRAMGGKVHIFSEKDVGTTVELIFPIKHH